MSEAELAIAAAEERVEKALALLGELPGATVLIGVDFEVGDEDFFRMVRRQGSPSACEGLAEFVRRGTFRQINGDGDDCDDGDVWKRGAEA